jgi:hypothetical protein
MTDYIKLFEHADMHANFSHSCILGVLWDVLSSLYLHWVDCNISLLAHVSEKRRSECKNYELIKVILVEDTLLCLKYINKL